MAKSSEELKGVLNSDNTGINTSSVDVSKAQITGLNINSSIPPPPIISRLNWNNPYSFKTVLQDIQRFRVSANSEGDYWDFPGHTFFKILFHFANGSDIGTNTPSAGFMKHSALADKTNDSLSGLIAPGWLGINDNPFVASKIAFENTSVWPYLWAHSCAWNYFMWNGDVYRANCIATFIELLSNINARTPWYFQKIKGLEGAVKREIVNLSGEGASFEVKPARPSIQIECLEDSYDQRIGTLLDLYRSAVWDWQNKREMLPANLRKFDMTIIQFTLPTQGTQVPMNGSVMPTDLYRAANIVDQDERGSTKSGFEEDKRYAAIFPYPNCETAVASFKAFEFHGCEIDYGSNAAGNAELDNKEPQLQNYLINIFFDDCIELRGNEFLGSFIISDAQNEIRLSSSARSGGTKNDENSSPNGGMDPTLASQGRTTGEFNPNMSQANFNYLQSGGVIEKVNVPDDESAAEPKTITPGMDYPSAPGGSPIYKKPNYKGSWGQSKLLKTLSGWLQDKAQVAINDAFNFLDNGTQYLNGSQMTDIVNKRLKRSLYGGSEFRSPVPPNLGIKNIFSSDLDNRSKQGSLPKSNSYRTGEFGMGVDLGNLYTDNIRSRIGALSNS